MKIINLTPHTINLTSGEIFPRMDQGGHVLLIRAEHISEDAGEINGIPVIKSSFGNPYIAFCDSMGRIIEKLDNIYQVPDLAEADVFIISMLALQAIKKAKQTLPGGLADCGLPNDATYVAPGRLVRDENGNIVGCEGFSTL